ncbi:MAG: VWA domain-containing protein [Chloroflexi bacterium]|nr:VWA domain-containing protein [Chloroflexota bacterium]
MTLRARSDRRFIRSAHRSERFVLVELEAPASSRKTQRDPLNVAFVIDRSGSMSGSKLDLARRAVETAVERLLPMDRFAIVAYDDRIDVVVESTPASREAKALAVGRLRTIDARGSTNLGEGWLRGAEQVARAQAGRDAVAGGSAVNRVLLLTDGLANQGMTDPAELTGHASELRLRGVTTTTFGVGEDFDETLLQSMADAGGGHYYFIANAAQIVDQIASEVGEMLEVVARDATLEITAPDGVGMAVDSLSRFPVEARGNRWLVRLGDLIAEQRLEIVLRVGFGYGGIGQEVGILIGVSDRDGALGAAGLVPVPVGWQYADDQVNDGQPRDRVVDRLVARLFAARARQEAVQLNRLGNYDAARQAVRSVARRIAAYADSDRELRDLVAELGAEEHRWAAPAPEMTRKAAFASANYTMRSRGPDGHASR